MPWRQRISTTRQCLTKQKHLRIIIGMPLKGTARWRINMMPPGTMLPPANRPRLIHFTRCV